MRTSFALAVCVALGMGVMSPCLGQAGHRPPFVIYSDAESAGEWTGYMPPKASMLTLMLADTLLPQEGKSCLRVHVEFMPPEWCGVAVQSAPDYWGEEPGPAFDLSGAAKLVFYARGETGSEQIQVKVAVCGDKKYGDSARLPAATRWLRLSPKWQRFELPLAGMDLSRCINPFTFVTAQNRNQRSTLTFYLDNISIVWE